jgi:multiple sugar transport system permease protein
LQAAGDRRGVLEGQSDLAHPILAALVAARVAALVKVRIMSDPVLQRAALATPPKLAHRIRGLSDRTIAWLFVAPTIFLLLAINIFPLIWTIRLSLTNFRTNRPNNPVEFVGIENYRKILTDEDTWLSLQATAHFLIWTLVLQVLIGFTLAYLINKKFRGNDLWTTLIVLPMMLSPAVVGNFWTFLYQPQIGLFNYFIQFLSGVDPASFSMIGDVSLAPWSIVIVDTWMWTPFVMLICLAGLRSIPSSIYEAAECDRASKWRQFWTITIPMALPFLMLAVLFRGIENFKMFDLVVQLTGGGPGSTTELTSIDLKREAFEKWRTGYASAYAVILFVTVFGLASIYVKALNKVKDR